MAHQKISATQCQFRQSTDDSDERYLPAYQRIILPMNGAVEVAFSDDTTAWYLDGRLHRDEGPAVEIGAFRSWYRHGRNHRDDGPAIEWPDGRQQWMVNGKTTKWRNPAYPEQDFG
jgi:hypothetical protein